MRNDVEAVHEAQFSWRLCRSANKRQPKILPAEAFPLTIGAYRHASGRNDQNLEGRKTLNGSSDRSTSDIQTEPEAASARTVEETSTTHSTASGARELGLWLLALHSFLNLRNHPLGEAERAEFLNRD